MQHAISPSHESWHVALEVCHEIVDVFCGLREVTRELVGMMEGADDRLVGKDIIDGREDGIEFRHHFLYLRHHFLHLAHSAPIESSLKGVAFLEVAVGSIAQDKVYLHISQQVARDFCHRTLGNFEMVVDFHLCDNLVPMVVIVIDSPDQSHLVSIFLDRTGIREATDIGKCHIISIVVGKVRHALEKLHAEKQQHNAYNCHQGYFYFFGESFHLIWFV